MPHISSLSLAAVLVAALLFSDPVTPAAAAPVVQGDAPAAVTPDSTPQWNVWGADHYALADDGADVWIGGVGGVVRWDKQQSTYRRYTMLDGLPHVNVLAAAVDAAGNRWFGGDGGLSRFDPAETWTHFQSTNSSLHTNYVDALAAVGDTVYISHGLPDGSIDRRDTDGSWRWYPNREAAVMADYALIVQAGGSNALWTVAGTEVWVGAGVFDGQNWTARDLPITETEPLSLAADSQGHVWALSAVNAVYEWDGAAWIKHGVYVSFSGRVTSLAVDTHDRVWVGMQERWGDPYTNEVANVQEVTGANSYRLNVAGPVVALLPTSDGLWAIGPGWVMRPDFSAIPMQDAPLFRDLPDAVAGAGGRLWFYSGIFAPYSAGVVQTLDDRGTMALEDDVWEQPWSGPNEEWPCDVVTAFERAGDDIWYTSYCEWRMPGYAQAIRRHGALEIHHPMEWYYYEMHDIFAVDERHVLFVGLWHSTSSAQGGILSLDDSGTPDDLADDVWETIPIETVSGKLSVAVDANGVLWHGQETGLYRYDGATWQEVYEHRAVCDLAPAADGALYAKVESYWKPGCDVRTDDAIVVLPDGSLDTFAPIYSLAADETGRVRTASRRNGLWAVAADGAIWYIYDSSSSPRLERRTAAGLEGYPLPMPVESVRRLEVDGRGHVWIVADEKLWRMEGPPPNRLFLPVLQTM